MIVYCYRTTPVVRVPLDKPKCEKCKYYLKETHGSVCKLFKYTFATDRSGGNYYLETDLARTDPALCGPYGIYFNPKDST